MARKGPILTLLGGLALAAVLVVVDMHATSGTRQQPTAGVASSVAASSAAPSGSGSLAPTTAASKPVTTGGRNTYAGYTGGGEASIAIAVKDGHAIAYLCDGSKVEAWLQGSASDGGLKLSGTHASSLTGTFAGGKATGSITVAGRHWTFHTKVVQKPSGLYRATAEVRGAKVVGGWIVVNKIQVGIVTVAGKPAAAPQIDPATGAVTVDGTALTALPVDGGAL